MDATYCAESGSLTVQTRRRCNQWGRALLSSALPESALGLLFLSFAKKRALAEGLNGFS
jgi:hypothetical protein